MAKFIVTTVLALSCLGLATVAEAQSYTAPAGIPVQAAQVPQADPLIVLPANGYTAVYSSRSAGTPVVHRRKHIHN